MRKKIIQILFVGSLLAMAMVFSGCNSTSANEVETETATTAVEEIVRDVRVATAQSGDVEELLTRATTMVAPNGVVITPETSGQIVYLAAEEGRTISVGQVIARLDDERAILAVERARSASDKAQHDLELARKQFAAKILNQETVLEAEHSWKQKVRDLQQAEINLAKCTIKAPVAGVITKRMVSRGDTIFAGSPIASLVDLSTLEAEILVPQNQVNRVAVGQPVVLIPGDDASRLFRGVVARISPVVDPTSGTVAVAVKVSNLDRSIRPGQFVTASVVTGIIKNAVLMPVQSIVIENAMSVVYKVVDSRVRRVAVEIGFNKNGFVQVSGDISSNDQVVISGHSGLDDMMKINVLPDLAEVF
jgi:membrane fusion protein (multidrug efflux system)